MEPQIKRSPGRLLAAMADPTYDGIDQDQDFFLEFVARNATSPQWLEGVLSLWVSAAAA